MARCCIALGGNLGDVPLAFRQALGMLAAPGTRLRAVSGLYRTPPMGSAAGDTFWNAAAELDTNVPPVALLDRLLDIEGQLGRVRTRHWGPRTIDLDLILYDAAVLATPRLTLPHPAAWFRRFVLDPLAEVAPDIWHPSAGMSVLALRERLCVRPLPVAIDSPRAVALADTLAPEFPTVQWLPNTAETHVPAFTLVAGAQTDALTRIIGLPSHAAEPDAELAVARAVLTAATGVPLSTGERLVPWPG